MFTGLVVSDAETVHVNAIPNVSSCQRRAITADLPDRRWRVPFRARLTSWRVMTSVAHAFQTFLSSLELTDSEHQSASRQQVQVRERLQASLGGVETSFLTGSYARGTAIRPLDDIDVFVQLQPAVHGDLRQLPPLRLLEHLHRAVRASYPDHKPRIQGRSVHLDFTGTGIGYDLVPAFAVGAPAAPESFMIPDRQQDGWIPTNPRGHRDACIAANQQAGGMLNGLIKAVKCWNRTHGANLGLRSFHLEVMSYSAFPTKPADPRTGLQQLFVHLIDAVTRPCPDPARLSPPLDADLPPAQRARAQAALRDAAVRAMGAVADERAGNVAAACRAWRELLGPQFPA